MLIIFVKNPILNQVKTRLAVGVGNEKALEIYRKLLYYTRDQAMPLDQAKEIWYGNEVPESDLWSDCKWTRILQMGEDLGERMARAFQRAFRTGHKRVVLIGSDNALIETVHLEKAFEQLVSHDLVLGPAKDGGYYLVGMRTYFDPVFKDMEWSQSLLFKQTMTKILAHQKSCYLLPTLSDIDTVEDLKGTFLENEGNVL